jgi:hypothetical protein
MINVPVSPPQNCIRKVSSERSILAYISISHSQNCHVRQQRQDEKSPCLRLCGCATQRRNPPGDLSYIPTSTGHYAPPSHDDDASRQIRQQQRTCLPVSAINDPCLELYYSSRSGPTVLPPQDISIIVNFMMKCQKTQPSVFASWSLIKYLAKVLVPPGMVLLLINLLKDSSHTQVRFKVVKIGWIM